MSAIIREEHPFNGKTILVTGGTGSFGQAFVKKLLTDFSPKAIRILSRDELKQWEMEKKFNNEEKLRFFVGDIRDMERIDDAMYQVDIVVHSAALKQVPKCEYNPFEAVKTNIIGTQNVVRSAIKHNVDKVVAISTDKAVNPVNLYGATKLCMEKIVISSNSLTGDRKTKLSCVRYGNVIGSRGSVIPLFEEQKKSGVVNITNPDMTRFLITLDYGVNFVMDSIKEMTGGEVFVPKIPSMKITSIAKAIAPYCEINIIGIRPGEKMHEVLVSKDEISHTIEYPHKYVIQPEYAFWTEESKLKNKKTVTSEYSSNTNKEWLTIDELQDVVKNE